MPRGVALDCPDWLLPELETSLGAATDDVLRIMRHRAPVFLRVNLPRATVAQAMERLAQEGIETRPTPLAATALQVVTNARRVRQSLAFTEGLVELQDAASQAVIAALPDLDGADVLDYCAGGGGKALAMAAEGANVTVHDADPARMRDIPERAKRAGAKINVQTQPKGLFDLVVTDVPCSGSGAWRRAPHGKWALTPERMTHLTSLQSAILRQAWQHVRPGGRLVYATCSLLDAENTAITTPFAAETTGATLGAARHLTPLDGGDGFFSSIIHKAS